jgi:hypothetical protein
MAGDPGFGEPKVIRRMREILRTRGSNLLAALSSVEVCAIINAYSKALEEIKAEEAAENERKDKVRQTERISEKDVGWFPGDCCD